MLVAKVELELMDNNEMVTLLERSIQGGYTENNKYISTYNPQMEIEYTVYADYNARDLSNMVYHLIPSKLRYLRGDEIEQIAMRSKTIRFNWLF